MLRGKAVQKFVVKFFGWGLLTSSKYKYCVTVCLDGGHMTYMM